MIIPMELIGWHGYSEAKIIQQDGENIVLDLSSWIDKDGCAEWKDGIMIKKEFPPHIVIFIEHRWNKEKICNECEEMVIAKGKIKGNQFYGKLFSESIFIMDKLSITFVHKVKSIKKKEHIICIEPEAYQDEEIKQIVENIRHN